MNAQGAINVADALIQTIEQEYEALVGLGQQFDAQLDALRTQELEAVEQATLEAHDRIAELERLRQTRARQMRLLGRVLGRDSADTSLLDLAGALDAAPDGAATAARLRTVRTRLREHAQATQQRCEELEFTLQYAVNLGREMLQVIQDLNVPPPSRVYTAAGTTSQASTPRSFVNKLG